MARRCAGAYLGLTTLLSMMSASLALPQDAGMLASMKLEPRASSSVPTCALASQPTWPKPPCQATITADDTALRLVNVSAIVASVGEDEKVKGVLRGILKVLAYEPQNEPVAAFTRQNGTVKIDVVPENTTVPLISEQDFKNVTDTRGASEAPGSWRPELSLNSKLQSGLLYVALLQTFYSPVTVDPRMQIDYEIWGNATVGLIGKIKVRAGTGG